MTGMAGGGRRLRPSARPGSTGAPLQDVVLPASAARLPSSLALVDDEQAAAGSAIAFMGSDADHADFVFDAAAGDYLVWIRAAAPTGSDAPVAWITMDRSDDPAASSPAGGYRGWPLGAGYRYDAVEGDSHRVTLADDGRHRLRLSVHDAPLRVDQVWLSLAQVDRPHDHAPRQPTVAPKGQLEEGFTALFDGESLDGWAGGRRSGALLRGRRVQSSARSDPGPTPSCGPTAAIATSSSVSR